MSVCLCGRPLYTALAIPMQRRMKAIMTTCFHSVRHKLSHKIGYFDLLGFDFMVDTQLNVSQSRTVLLLLVTLLHRCG